MKEVYKADKEKQKMVKKAMLKKLAPEMVGIRIATFLYRVALWLILIVPSAWFTVLTIKETGKIEPIYFMFLGLVFFLSLSVAGLVIFPIYLIVDKAREKHLADYSIDEGKLVFYDDYMDFCYFDNIYTRYPHYDENQPTRYRQVNQYIVNRINYADMKSLQIDLERKLIRVSGYHTIKCYKNERKDDKRWGTEQDSELRIPLIFPEEERLLERLREKGMYLL